MLNITQILYIYCHNKYLTIIFLKKIRILKVNKQKLEMKIKRVYLKNSSHSKAKHCIKKHIGERATKKPMLCQENYHINEENKLTMICRTI